MKKSLFIMALGAIALTSCSQDEIIEVKQDAIGFSVATENASRATAKTALGEDDNFIVYANESVGENLPYINGVVASTDGNGGGNGQFKLASTYYWPVNALNFYCISPANPSNDNYPEYDNGDGLSVSNNVPAIKNYMVDASHSEDLLYSVATGLKRGGSNGTDGQEVRVEADGIANINFRHALAMIQFQFKSDPTYNLDVEVSYIHLFGMHFIGDYTLPSVTTDINTFDTENTHGTWNTRAQSTVGFDTYSWEENHSVTPNGIASTAGETYFLLPQTVTAATPNNGVWNGAYFKINCVIKRGGVTVYNGQVQIPVTTAGEEYTWKEGYKYLYTFTFGQGGGYSQDSDQPAIVPISFDVEVDEMKDAPEQAIEVAVPESEEAGE